LKVLHLSSIDVGGGAIRATNALHGMLGTTSVDSKVLVQRKLGNDPTFFETLGERQGLANQLWRRLTGRVDQIPTRFLKTNNTAGHSPEWVPDFLATSVNQSDADIVNLHWVCEGFMNPRTLPKIKKPVVWTSYDMWPICGAEHYAGNCTRYIDGYHCDNRPQGESGFDLNRWVWRRKRAAWANLENVTTVVATKWLADCFQRSVLFRDAKIEVIPHGIDHKVFKKLDKRFARQVLNLPQDVHLILFGAMGGTGLHRKGFQFLVPALKLLHEKDLVRPTQLVVFGTSTPDPRLNFGFNVSYLGKLDTYSLALAYAAADVFTMPSMEDNLPLTILESLSCATPVVSFDIGGVLDVMAHKETGYLAKSFDVDDLVHGIEWVLEDETRRERLGDSGRSRIESGFTLEIQATAYGHLYKKIHSEVRIER
jgi:glycosyltransferase involved in cell wall biosynthesis